jgi:hypothetical protein
MYKGQYIICNKATVVKLPDNFISHSYDKYFIHAHKSLKVCIYKGQFFNMALIGNYINPFRPYLTDYQIAEMLSNTDKKKIHSAIDGLTGRFVVMAKGDGQFFARGDAFHYRQLFFGKHNSGLVLTSSVRLFLNAFNLTIETDDRVKSMMAHPLFQKTEHSWFGNYSEDARLKKLLPNHILHLDTLHISRLSLGLDNYINEDEKLGYLSTVLTGTYKALSLNYSLYQPITCGLDTRLLLAASKEVKSAINYYIFDRSGGKSDDVKIASNLSRKLDLNFSIIKPQPLQDYFLEKFAQEHNYPRKLPKTVNIQHHYYQKHPDNALNISGNGAGIYKVPFGLFRQRVKLDHILAFSGYFNKVPFISQQLQEWYKDAIEYNKSTGVDILDLFYWEQRMGNWGALYPFEQDIAIEEFSPYSNRNFLLTMLQIDPNERKAPKYHAVRALMFKLWPEVLSEPINPHTNIFWKNIKGHGELRYLVLKANHMRF